MKNKESINVYFSFDHVGKKPLSMFHELVKEKTTTNISDNIFFKCPAVSKLFKNTFIFKNQNRIDFEYKYEYPNMEFYLKNHMSERPFVDIDPSLSLGPQIAIPNSYLLFSEEPLMAKFTGPYFHKSGYMNYGSIYPGEFDIGKWFRQYNLQFQMWENSGKMIVEKNEPLFYVTFDTEKKINLIEFKQTEKIIEYAKYCIESPFTKGKHKRLFERYLDFNDDKMRELVLLEIKNNLMGEVYE